MKQVLVKITAGVYGHHVKKGVVGKTTNDPPFLLDKDKAERLFKLGVATEVKKAETPGSETSNEEVEVENEAPFSYDPAEVIQS